MFKVGDRVVYSNEDYDQNEVGIIEEVILNDFNSDDSLEGFEPHTDCPDICYAVHWTVANFDVTIHHSMLKLK
jgi:hypothetical protein